MKATYAISNKDNTGSSLLLASIFILVASAVFASAHAVAKTSATNSPAQSIAANGSNVSEALVVTATRLK